jgi:hypothetical protein
MWFRVGVRCTNLHHSSSIVQFSKFSHPLDENGQNFRDLYLDLYPAATTHTCTTRNHTVTYCGLSRY